MSWEKPEAHEPSKDVELGAALSTVICVKCGVTADQWGTWPDCEGCRYVRDELTNKERSETVASILSDHYNPPASPTPTTQSREAELAKALQWALDRLPACVAMPTSHDFNQYEKYRVLASTTPAPVGDESPSLAKARREGALAALTYASNHSPSSTWNEVDGQITVCTCGWKCDAVKIHIIRERWTKHILSLPITTILAQHRDVPAGSHPSDDQDNSPICRANDRSGR